MVPSMTEVALDEEASVREVDVDGGMELLLVFWATVEENLDFVSARGGRIKAGMKGQVSDMQKEMHGLTSGCVLVFECVG